MIMRTCDERTYFPLISRAPVRSQAHFATPSPKTLRASLFRRHPSRSEGSELHGAPFAPLKLRPET